MELDSEKMELRLPQEKLEKVKEELSFWALKKSRTKRKLLSLIGLLQYCCQAVVLGRPFLRRLIDRASSVAELHHFVRLSVWERDDILWWNFLFQEWNGRSMFLLPKWEAAPNIMITSDAAGSIGFAAIHENEWFAEKWPQNALTINMAVKEFIPIIIAAKVWGSSWERKRVAFHSDNMAEVNCIKNTACKDRHLSFLLRELTTIAIMSSFTFTAVHIPGVQNSKADALSRFDLQKFRELSPQATLEPIQVSQMALRHLLFPPWT